MTHLSLEVRGPDQTAAVLAQRYAVVIDSTLATPGMRLEQDSVPGVDLSRIRYAMDFTAAAHEPRAATFIARLRTGALGYRFAHHDNRWAAGDVFVATPAGSTMWVEVHDCDVEFAAIAPSAFVAVAQTAAGGPPALTGWRPVSGTAGQQWLRTFDFARRTAADPGTPPLMAGAAARLVAATALATFPNDATVDPTVEDRRDALPLTVRRAVAFIEAHPDRDVSVVDIAAAVHVTPRAVQLAFRRHLGTTPMAYLRRVRLDRAHAELRSADPARTTVTAVAGRWGFTDAGRFARRYRETYGRPPSTTLYS
ncbi:helix-turn-helix transcriptional regulator [Klenkia brasiliensis]|uniref:AraC-type DNA-binding protein n=1 Tax=Klenkia brasiliensis TaxID=333142 RepID=A0A1G8AAL8_9ACTN|nr:helix-turn-helix transcriptional regulator [Klenkia brasiliensis]SDH17927.1 AraC-type DNA-binding protein [Klenkia brasiliensis]